MRVAKMMVVELVLVGVGAVGRPQTNEAPKVQRSPRQMMRVTVTPITIETLRTEVRTSPDGKSTTTQRRMLSANDSQDRHLFVNTVLNTGLTMTTLWDPVKAVQMVWSSAHPVVKVLHNAVPVSGRSSCWKVEQDQIHSHSNDEAQIGITSFRCGPAEQAMMAGQCAMPSVAEPLEKPSPARPAPAQADCEQWLRGERLLDANQKAEDLGDAVVAGWPAHGCRIVKEWLSLKRQLTREFWITGLPPDNRQMAVRTFREMPLPGGDTVKMTDELEVLRGGEPDESMFEPPKDYEQKVLALTEVPCDSLLPGNAAKKTTGQ